MTQVSEQEAQRPDEPVLLSEAETRAVAAGLVRVVGCPTCTSGGHLDLMSRYASVVNPNPVEQTAVLPASIRQLTTARLNTGPGTARAPCPLRFPSKLEEA